MKKLRSIILLVIIVSMTSLSFSLLKAEGTYSAFAKQGGLGVGVNFPVIPLVDTTFYFHMLGEATVSGTGSISGISFTGSAKMEASAIEMQAKLPISIMGVNVGASLLADLLTGKEPTSGDTVALPGSLYGGLFVNYQQGLLPLVSYYGQVGMLVKIIDGEEAVNDKVSGGSFDLSNIDRTGLYFRVGVSVGI